MMRWALPNAAAGTAEQRRMAEEAADNAWLGTRAHRQDRGADVDEPVGGRTRRRVHRLEEEHGDLGPVHVLARPVLERRPLQAQPGLEPVGDRDRCLDHAPPGLGGRGLVERVLEGRAAALLGDKPLRDSDADWVRLTDAPLEVRIVVPDGVRLDVTESDDTDVVKVVVPRGTRIGRE